MVVDCRFGIVVAGLWLSLEAKKKKVSNLVFQSRSLLACSINRSIDYRFRAIVLLPFVGIQKRFFLWRWEKVEEPEELKREEAEKKEAEKYIL